MGAGVVLALDPGVKPAVHGFEVAGVPVLEPLQDAAPDSPEPAFDLSLSRRLPGPRMDQDDAEPGADERQVPGAEIRTVIDVEFSGIAPLQQGKLEHRQEGGGVLREREGRMRDDSRAVIYERQEIRLAPPPVPVAALRAVHDVRHPEIARVRVLEAPPVLRRRSVVIPHQPFAGQEAVNGRGRQGHVRGDVAVLPDPGDGVADAERGVLPLHGDQRLGRLDRQPPRLSVVAPPLREERVEAAGPVEAHPVAHGLLADAGAVRARNHVVPRSPVAEACHDLVAAGRLDQQVRDQSVPEERDVPSQAVVIFRHVGLLAVPGLHGPDSTSLRNPGRKDQGSRSVGGPRTVPWPVPGGRNPTGGGRCCRWAAQRPRSSLRTDSVPSRARKAAISGAAP